jgi:nucleoside phosphorylase
VRILIVHDRDDIGAEIRSIAIDECDADAIVDVVADAMMAREALRMHTYDLLILDITLPYIKNKTEVDVRTADELLAEIFQLTSLPKPGDIIGITRERDAILRIKNNLGPHMMTIIEEDGSGDWKGQIKDKIAYTRLLSESRLVSINRTSWFDVLLITALDEEAVEFESIFDLADLETYKGVRAFTFADKNGSPRRGALFAIGQSGQAAAASATQSLVSFLRPSVAILTGFCAGVEGRAVLGDLVFFERAYDWDYGKWTSPASGGDPKFEPRPQPIDLGDGDMRRAIRELLLSDAAKAKHWEPLHIEYPRPPEDRCRLTLKSAASGSSVVGHSKVVDQISEPNGSIYAIDMESYGMYHACTHTHVVKPRFLCVKSVADYGDGKKGDLYHQLCAARAAEAARLLITQFIAF